MTYREETENLIAIAVQHFYQNTHSTGSKSKHEMNISCSNSTGELQIAIVLQQCFIMLSSLCIHILYACTFFMIIYFIAMT